MRPTRAGRLIAVVMASLLRSVGGEQARGLRLAEVAGLFQNRRNLGVGDEVRPPLLVPVEQRPDPVLLGGVAEHRRALAAVVGALVGALRAEHLEESVDVLDGRRCQNHRGSPLPVDVLAIARPRLPVSTDVAQYSKPAA